MKLGKWYRLNLKAIRAAMRDWSKLDAKQPRRKRVRHRMALRSAL